MNAPQEKARLALNAAGVKEPHSWQLSHVMAGATRATTAGLTESAAYKLAAEMYVSFIYDTPNLTGSPVSGRDASSHAEVPSDESVIAGEIVALVRQTDIWAQSPSGAKQAGNTVRSGVNSEEQLAASIISTLNAHQCA